MRSRLPWRPSRFVLSIAVRPALVSGDSRRKSIYQALAAIDDELRPVLQRKKYVVIKPNIVSTTNQLAATHADALRGILDYLAPRFRGPVIIAESGGALRGDPAG